VNLAVVHVCSSAPHRICRCHVSIRC